MLTFKTEKIFSNDLLVNMSAHVPGNFELSGQVPKVKPEFNLLRIHIFEANSRKQRRPLTYNRFQSNILNALFLLFYANSTNSDPFCSYKG